MKRLRVFDRWDTRRSGRARTSEAHASDRVGAAVEINGIEAVAYD
jgi:hypothetical protein